MDLSLETRLFYFASGFLYAGVSLWHYLYDEIATPEIGQRYLRWSSAHELLAGWLLDEQLFATDTNHATERDDRMLHRVWVRRADDLVARWAAIIRSTGRKAHQMAPAENQEMCVYFLYCRSLLELLSQFERLINGPRLRSSEFWGRYADNTAKFADLRTLLQNELRAAGVSRNASAGQFAPLHLSAETSAKQVAQGWLNALEATALDIALE